MVPVDKGTVCGTKNCVYNVACGCSAAYRSTTSYYTIQFIYYDTCLLDVLFLFATSFFPVLPGRRRRWMAAEFCPGTLGCWHFNKNGWFPNQSMVDIEDFEHVVVISLDRKASDYNNILWGATTLPKLPNPPGWRFSKLLAITMFQLQPGRIPFLAIPQLASAKEMVEQNVALRKAMRQLEARCVWGRFVSCLFIYLSKYILRIRIPVLVYIVHYGSLWSI